MTYLGQHYIVLRAALILDLYSRKVVGFEVHDTDNAEHAAQLARRTALVEGIHAMSARPVLHGDNGASLKATTVRAMLRWLGSSRPTRALGER
jgi:putative transposase